MSVAGRELFLCSCNGTQPLDAAAIGRALDLPAAPKVRTMLCQKELPAFAEGAHGDVLVACTQESRLFEEVAREGARTPSAGAALHNAASAAATSGASTSRKCSPW